MGHVTAAGERSDVPVHALRCRTRFPLRQERSAMSRKFVPRGAGREVVGLARLDTLHWRR